MARNEQAAAQRALYEKQVNAEIRRIKRFMRAAEKRGYVFSDNAIPSKPQKITEATVRKFKAITPKSLYKKSVYIDQTKKVRGETRRKQERSAAAKKGAETRRINRTMKILKEVRRIIKEWTPNPVWSDELARLKEHDKNLLESVLNGAISMYGETEVAKRMDEHAAEVIELTFAICYGNSKDKEFAGRSGVQLNLARFAAIIHGRPLTREESMRYTEYGESEEYEDEIE